MESEHFKDTFQEKVNIALSILNNNITRRLLSDTDEFNAIHIEIIDPYNHTQSTRDPAKDIESPSNSEHKPSST
eukprot:CAMPEP_0201586584 /NCGR_PEP_ID=MMETSP0190_2-20130828/134238_1 /ASSEMBLY_ACC=CAM_ASM_000263 /TAXON_ID=37353 /ORGANISM="Rosalina sp." /LENGTH=73 /DNA_ID=CAMNT_0048034845 /DNA_START=95 /DNA_END=313 /DNA_ORIENTATION=+